MLVPVGPVHHAGPVLAEVHDEAGPVEADDRDEDNPVFETGDLQETPRYGEIKNVFLCRPETEDDDAASEENAAPPRPTEYVPRYLRRTHPTEVKIHETKFKILD